MWEEGRSENDILKEESVEQKRRMTELDRPEVWTFPSTWYQSVNPLCIIVLGPIFAGLWSFLGRRNGPSTPVKFGIGLIMLSIAFLFMIGGAIHAERRSVHRPTGFGDLCLLYPGNSVFAGWSFDGDQLSPPSTPRS